MTNRHPVDVYLDLLGPELRKLVTPEHEAEMRALCDAPAFPTGITVDDVLPPGVVMIGPGDERPR